MQYTINRPRPPTTWDFLQFPLWLFAYSWLSATGVVLIAHYGYWWAFPLAIAGGVAAVLTIRQAARFDVSIWYVMNPQIDIHQDKPQPVKVTEPVNRTETGNGQHLQFSGIELGEHEWPIFAGMMLRLKKITYRDLDALGFPSLANLDKKPKGKVVTKYTHIVDGLKAMGWVDSGGNLTDSGREYFLTKVQKQTPLPDPVFVAASVHTSDNDAATTKRGGAK